MCLQINNLLIYLALGTTQFHRLFGKLGVFNIQYSNLRDSLKERIDMVKTSNKRPKKSALFILLFTSALFGKGRGIGSRSWK
jgi:hypothetical protein